MTAVTVNNMDASQANDMEPPPGTAVVRPSRYVRAVRERHAERFADASKAAASRSAHAWAWALGECATAPVTGRETAVPPARPDIEAEIAEADERRLRGDREDRADDAAAVLRWLIGDDDHVPIWGSDRGELVGGFGDVVRSRNQIAGVLTVAAEGRQRAAAMVRNTDVHPDTRRWSQQDADFLAGVAATLAWVLDEQAQAPVTGRQPPELTTWDLKAERVHAEDVIEQAKNPGAVGQLPPCSYGEGVKFSIMWLLGDWTAQPVDPSGRGPYGQGSELPSMLHEAQARQHW
jgi:hypothetical protein